MTIKENTEMLLFRFSNYGKNSFINEHKAVIDEYGYVWMLKIGKRSSLTKLHAIKDAGGWLVLRSPKADGSVSYIARFTDVSEEEPNDFCYPRYYNDIFDGDEDEYYNPNAVYQWFKIESLAQMEKTDVEHLVISKTGKIVNEIIGTTRTAVMFIKNNKPLVL